jgi:aminopeptidase
MYREYEKGVIAALEGALCIRPNEVVVVLTDLFDPNDERNLRPRNIERTNETLLSAAIFADVTERLFPDNSVLIRCIPHEQVPEHRDAEISKKVSGGDIVVAITNQSISHLSVCKTLLRTGMRIASMPGFQLRMLNESGPLDIDYQALECLGAAVTECLAGVQDVYLSTPSGTSLRLDIGHQAVIDGTRRISQPGDFGNIPIGEVFTAPCEGSADGILVVEPGWYPDLDIAMELRFRDGYVVELNGGGSVGNRLRELLKIGSEPTALTKSRCNCAELGIGLNKNARAIDTILESEKILGTVHIAIGDNKGFGGTVKSDIHIDFVVPRPTLILDGVPLISNGDLNIK